MTSPAPRLSKAQSRRLFELVEPVAVVTYMAAEPTEAVMALGAGNVWDAYFAGRAHVLHALSEGMPAEQFGRVGHLPRAQLAAVIDGMRARGLVGADGWLTAARRQIKDQVEALTDELAAPAYDVLDPDELDQLIEDLESLAAVLVPAGSQ